MSIINISDLELYLQKTITGTSDEDKYDFLIIAIQDLAESICNRKFDATNYTEIQDGTGTSEIYLDQYPINSITSVNYGWVWNSGTRTEIVSGDYLSYADTGRLAFSFNTIEDNQVFEVVYNAGWSQADPSNISDAPYDLKMILMDQIEGTFQKEFTSSDIKSENLGDYSYTKFSASEKSTNSDTSIFSAKLNKYIKSDL